MSEQLAQQQRTRALNQANVIRLAMYRLKSEIYALPRPEGIAVVADLLRNADNEAVERMKVGQLLGSIRRWGPRATEKAIMAARIGNVNVNTKVGSMVERQRAELARVLLGRAP